MNSMDQANTKLITISRTTFDWMRQSCIMLESVKNDVKRKDGQILSLHKQCQELEKTLLLSEIKHCQLLLQISEDSSYLKTSMFVAHPQDIDSLSTNQTGEGSPLGILESSLDHHPVDDPVHDKAHVVHNTTQLGLNTGHPVQPTTTVRSSTDPPDSAHAAGKHTPTIIDRSVITEKTDSCFSENKNAAQCCEIYTNGSMINKLAMELRKTKQMLIYLLQELEMSQAEQPVLEVKEYKSIIRRLEQELLALRLQYAQLRLAGQSSDDAINVIGTLQDQLRPHLLNANKGVTGNNVETPKRIENSPILHLRLEKEIEALKTRIIEDSNIINEMRMKYRILRRTLPSLETLRELNRAVFSQPMTEDLRNVSSDLIKGHLKEYSTTGLQGADYQLNDDWKAQHGDLRAQHDEMKTQYDDLQAQHTELMLKHNKYKSQYKEVETVNKADCNDGHEGLQTSQTDLTKRFYNLELDENYLRTQLHDLEVKHQDLQTQNAALKLQHVELKTQHAELQVKYNDLHTKWSDLDKEHSDVKMVNNDLQKQNNDFQKRNNELQTQNYDLQIEQKDLKTKNSSLNSQNIDLNKECDELKIQSSLSGKCMENPQDTLDGERIEQENRGLKKQVKLLSDSLEVSNQKLQKYKTQLIASRELLGRLQPQASCAQQVGPVISALSQHDLLVDGADSLQPDPDEETNNTNDDDSQEVKLHPKEEEF